MYEVTCDRANGVLHVALSGMLTVDEVVEYIAALKRTVVENHLRTYAMIIDVTACPIQHQEVIRAMATQMTAMPKARAVAIVTGSSLAKMQIRRLFTQSYARIVESAFVARSWVVDGIEPQAA